MNKLEKYYGSIHLDADISKKLVDTGLVSITLPVPISTGVQCEADAFTADGFPKELHSNTLYPMYAAYYLGYPIPSSYLDVAAQYRSTASEAAIQWACKALGGICDYQHIDGCNADLETFFPVTGAGIRLCVPKLSVNCFIGIPGNSVSYPVIAWPDSRDNDQDWKDGRIPYYAEVVARTMLWAWENDILAHDGTRSQQKKAYIVRITGNTPGDLLVRTVVADVAKDSKLMERIVRACRKAMDAGKDPLENLNRLEQQHWLEVKQENEANAFRIEDEDFHETVRQYMECRSHRKTLEQREAELKAQMDAIRIKLAAGIELGNQTGSCTDGGFIYSVSHAPAITRKATISGELIRQYFPQYSDHISTLEYEKGRVDIDTL